MDDLIHAADAALRCSPSPAMPLSHLVEEARAATGSTTLDPHRLLAGLRHYPERFKVLEPGKGPWRFVSAGSAAPSPTEPWVVSLRDPESPEGAEVGTRIQSRLRESVRLVTASVDQSSPRDVARWYALALSGQATARVLREKKAA